MRRYRERYAKPDVGGAEVGLKFGLKWREHVFHLRFLTSYREPPVPPDAPAMGHAPYFDHQPGTSPQFTYP